MRALVAENDVGVPYDSEKSIDRFLTLRASTDRHRNLIGAHRSNSLLRGQLTREI
jgi:hypothetical protein